ncbi:MAG TPA: right-handed parallel beta-helix repeat-containing protein [Anaerohalosphaeraceae bacterium]|jgi:hypothetical protein|nr:right-handed parallel beta-helix repeat-containing protein [Anaerohalosphaeraceae bacterium]HRT48886.1 right-handed parallel beta-helix repeat-containing protein [Anaerohalosphaeraceae bacterium]HRT85009.1 right-handed parallel beta-helix repeat-containing protein [Anaerohalosphaeraceae bacterium]
MGYPVFYTHASMFFVGGNGVQSRRTPYAGGCTKAWWDAQCPNNTDAEKIAALNKLMINGGPVVDEADCTFTAANSRITKSGCFAGVESGMVAYVTETPAPGVHLETMRYLITNVDPAGNWIEIGHATGQDATVTVRIGGAFDSLQTALDETAADNHSVWIHTNLRETLTASLAVDHGGDVLRNTFKRVAGYHTVPGDMACGGTHHESPLTILQNGTIDPARCIALDANGGGFPALTVHGADNVVFENLHLCNTAANCAIHFSTVCRNTVFRNCRFTDASYVVNTESDCLLFENCYSHDDITGHHYNLRGDNALLLGCVGRMAPGTNLCNFINRSGAVIGCILVGGQFGVRIAGPGASATIIHNTFIDTELDGVLCDGGDGATILNNIFCLAPTAVGIYLRTGGSVVHTDHNCFIAVDGAPLTIGAAAAGTEPPLEGPHSLRVNPDFADAAAYDLRPRNPAVLRGGRPAPDGRPTVIGAIGQEYIFHPRARMTAAGRMTILR